MASDDAAFENRVQTLADLVRKGKKYRDIADDVAKHAVRCELTRRQDDCDVVRCARSRLHQVAGAYISDTRWDRRSARLVTAAEEGRESLCSACRQLMMEHASTRERLSDLEPYYEVIAEAVGPVRSVLDIGCGLNPLAISWMSLSSLARYEAWDAYMGLADMLNTFFSLVGVTGKAVAGDMTTASFEGSFDLALLLKVVNNADQLEPGSARRLLENLDAQNVIVSYPRRTLGGRKVGMEQTYREQLLSLVADGNWRVQELPVACELVFHLARR